MEVIIMDVKDGIKSILLAGIGAAALAAEKTGEIADTLVTRGEQAVEQGKALNQELKHRVSEKMAEKKDISAFVRNLTEEEREQLKKELSDTGKEKDEPECDA